MRPLLLLLVAAVLALFGKCPEAVTALGATAGLIFGGLLHVLAEPALLAAIGAGLAITVIRAGRAHAREAH